MKKLLCKLAHWILDNFEPIDVFNTKIRLKSGTYKVVEVVQNYDFSEITIKAEREKQEETITFSA